MEHHILDKKYAFCKEYGVLQTSYENNEEKSKISFLTTVEKFEIDNYRIHRKDIFINHSAPNLIAEQIADKIGNIFFPLEVETLENGNLKKISNIEDIKQRWKILKPQLSKYYKAEAEKIIARIENEIASRNTVQNRIFNSLFYRLYFLPFRDYGQDTDANFNLYLPISPFKNKVKYEVKLAEKPTLSETEKLIIRLSGKCADPRSYHQIKNNTSVTATEEKENKCNGTIEALYKFNKKEGSLYSANVEIILESEDQKTSKKIIFELYEQ